MNILFHASNVDMYLYPGRRLLDDTDSRVAYYSSAFLLKVWYFISFKFFSHQLFLSIFTGSSLLSQRMMTDQPENYQRMLQNLIVKAQQVTTHSLLPQTLNLFLARVITPEW